MKFFLLKYIIIRNLIDRLIWLLLVYFLLFASSPPNYSQGYDYPRQDDVYRLYTQLTEQPASMYGPPSNNSRYNG